LALEWLFRGKTFAEVLEEREERLRAAVGRLSPEQLEEPGLAARLAEEHAARVPELREGRAAVVEHGETEVEARDPLQLTGRQRVFRTVIAVPYDGDGGLFRVQPSVFPSVSPRAEVLAGELRLACVREDDEAEGLRREYRETLRAIREQLARLSEQASRFHRGLEGAAARYIEARRRELGSAAGAAAALGLDLRPPERAEALGAAAPPEVPGEDREYEEALRMARNMARVMELDPAAFAQMSEEELRSHFLVQLNGRFGGQATGETFNFRGKTDILVRSGGRNVLIGECKFWSGESELMAAVDQLLSYLSWRDTRAALILFGKQESLSLVLDRIELSVPGHPRFVRDLGKADETTFRYAFAHPQDEAREVLLTVLVFDLPGVERGRSGPRPVTRERRTGTLLGLLAEREWMTYEEAARELQVSRGYLRDLVSRAAKRGLVRKRRVGKEARVGLKPPKKVCAE